MLRQLNESTVYDVDLVICPMTSILFAGNADSNKYKHLVSWHQQGWHAT